MSEFIRYAKPKRWKILQALPIMGQNDTKIGPLMITEGQLHKFIQRHAELSNCTNIIPESNDDMTGSYAMVDPEGRFFDNSKGKHTYSSPITEVGSRIAIQQVSYDFGKFVARRGIYKWKRSREIPERSNISGKVGPFTSSQMNPPPSE
jgi:radical S-adenosyl methionine domain-containing protein 2